MASKIYECIEKIGNRIIEEKDFLTELDREIGDADHGINMARGFTEVLAVIPKDNDNIGEVLKKTGMTLLSKVGGASGPLYGTAYMQAGKICAGKTSLTPEDGKAILTAALPSATLSMRCARPQKKVSNTPRRSKPPRDARAISETAASDIRIRAPLPQLTRSSASVIS